MTPEPMPYAGALIVLCARRGIGILDYRPRSAFVHEGRRDGNVAAIAEALELVETEWHDGFVDSVTFEEKPEATVAC
jgi:hypothetical protein